MARRSLRLVAATGIARAELRLLRRDPAALVLLFLLPALFVVILSVALEGTFSSGRDEDRIAALLVDEDGGSLGQAIAQGAADTRFMRLVDPPPGAPPSRDEAIAGLRRAAWDAVVVLPPHSSEAAGFDGHAVVEVYADPAASAEVAGAVASVIRNAALGASLTDVRRRFDPRWEPDVDPVAEAEPRGVEVRQIFLSAEGTARRPNAVQQNVPGWTIFALFWIAQLLAINLIHERQGGIHDRLLAAPISPAAYVVGKLVPYFAVNLLQAVAMFAVGVWLLPLLGGDRLDLVNLPALALLTVALSLCSLSFGALVAALMRSPIMAAAATAALLLVMAVLGGLMVPKFVMPDAMQRLTLVVPQGWALEGYLAILVRGSTTAGILPHVGALLGFAAVPLSIAVWRMGRSDR